MARIGIYILSVLFLVSAPAKRILAQSPGLLFKEIMSGAVKQGEKSIPLKLDLVAAISDIKAWESDPNHPLIVTGPVTWGNKKIQFQGTLEMMAPARVDQESGRYLRYDIRGEEGGDRYHFRCAKHLPFGAQNLIVTTTTCRGEFEDPIGTWPATVKFRWQNPIVLVKFLTSFKVTGPHNALEGLQARSTFMKVYLGGIWNSLFGKSKERPGTKFAAPDSGSEKTPYACSFHWFQVGEQRWVGLDVIRSDDTGNFALRAFVIEKGRPIRAFIKETPAQNWAPFATEAKPDLNGDADVLGRGKNWIAGSVHVEGETYPIRFDLDLIPARGFGWGRAPLEIMKMTAEDFTQIQYRGYIELDGQVIPVNSPGIASVHYGLSLPQYAYAASLSRDSATHPFLVGTFGADNLKWGGRWLLAGRSVIYGYGENEFPNRVFNLSKLKNRSIPLGPGVRLDFSNLSLFPHDFLGVKTITAYADAELVTRNSKGENRKPLGTVVLDYRGPRYTGKLE